MCSKAEVQAIVSEAETRLERKMEMLELQQIKRLEDSHMAIAKSVSGFGSDLKKLTERIEGVVKLYDGVSTIKGFVVGLATVIIAISAIGASIIWVIKTIMK
jgi:hypothetical protein